MSAIDTLFFEDFDTIVSLTGPDTSDGFFFDDIGMPETVPPETGYTGGGRYTWSGGAQPMGMVQTVRAGGKLIIGFFSRFDQTFDPNDALMIWLKPDSGSSRQQHRRIEIFPVQAGLGATGGGGAPSGPFNIHSGATAIALNVWKGAPASEPDPNILWHPCTQPIVARVRSWAFGGSGGVGWSVEVEIPTAPGTDWIALGSSFRLMTQMIRQHDVSGSTMYSVLQFPRGPKFTGAIDGNTADLPGDGFFGTARVGTATSEGVRFLNASPYSIGRLKGGAITQTMSNSTNVLIARIENLSSDAAPAVTAEFRFGDYGIPPGGGPTYVFNGWRQPTGMSAATFNPKRTAPIDLPGKPPAGSPPRGDLTANWTLASPDDDDFKNDHDRCIVAILHSINDVNFSQASIRVNLSFSEASETEQDVTVSGEGYDPPADGSGEQEFVMFSFTRLIHGPDALAADPNFSRVGETAQFMQALVSQVLPDPADDKERIEGRFASAPAVLRWFSDDIAPQIASIAVKAGDDKRRRVRVLGPGSLTAEAFEWEALDTVAVPGRAVEVKVRPVERAGDSARKAKLHYQVLDAIQGADGNRDNWQVVDAGAVDLLQASAKGLKPGIDFPGALNDAEALLLINFALRRTGKMSTVGGVTGEVLDETSGEFALGALHQGLGDVFGWSLSGPALEWVRPGVSIVRVPDGGKTHLDLRLTAGPRDDGKEGDLGPRYVQADPLRLEWRANESEDKRLVFTHKRKGAPDDVLELEVAAPVGGTPDDFAWKAVKTRIAFGASVEIPVRPPASSSAVPRGGEIAYRVTGHGDGPRRIFETGRIRLTKHGTGETTTEPTQGDTQGDIPRGCLALLWSLIEMFTKR